MADRMQTVETVPLTTTGKEAALEPEFWQMLEQISALEGTTLTDIVAKIDKARGDCGRASAIRVFILEYYAARSDDDNSRTWARADGALSYWIGS